MSCLETGKPLFAGTLHLTELSDMLQSDFKPSVYVHHGSRLEAAVNASDTDLHTNVG